MTKLDFSGLGRRKSRDGAVLPTSQLHIPMPKVTPLPARPPSPASEETKARG